MNRNGAVRRAFTIVELLVVIAIIGVLIALLLPAVNSARESGRRAACANNLKQLGLAMLQYEELNKILPINWGTQIDNSGTATTGINSVGHSWLTGILVFLEEKQIYDMIQFGQPMNYRNAAGTYVNWQAARQAVVEFACPSDPGERVSTSMEPLASDNNVLPTEQSDGTPDKRLGTTNYKACAGMNWAKAIDPKTNLKVDVHIWAKRGRNTPASDPNLPSSTQPLTYEFDHGNGITCRGCLRLTGSSGQPIVTPLYTTADRDIKDGRTKTFAIGEAVPSWCPYSAWYSYEGATATCGIPLNYIAVMGNRDLTGADTNYKDYYSRSFASYHPGGANFCMCDGSVMFIKDDIMLQQKDTDFGYLFSIPPPNPLPSGYIDPNYLIINGSNYVPGAYMNMATIDGGELVQPQK